MSPFTYGNLTLLANVIYFSNRILWAKKREKLSVSCFDVEKDSELYDLFVFAINADQTREKCITRLKKFFEIIGIDREKKLMIQERCKVFTEKARAEIEG